jgi:hypothetical protein
MPAHEAVTLVDDIEDAGGVRETGSFGLALEDLVDEVVFPLLGSIELQVPTDLSQLRDAHLSQVTDLEVVALARGLDLLHLIEFTDWGASGAAATAAGPTPVAQGALVWTGHLDRGHL